MLTELVMEEAKLAHLENWDNGSVLGSFNVCLICSPAYRVIFIGLETILMKPYVVHQNGMHFSQRLDLVKPLEI